MSGSGSLNGPAPHAYVDLKTMQDDMACACQDHARSLLAVIAKAVLRGRTAEEERDAQTVLATMDHADIRGLVTAFHLSVAGLPAL